MANLEEHSRRLMAPRAMRNEFMVEKQWNDEIGVKQDVEFREQLFSRSSDFKLGPNGSVASNLKPYEESPP